MGIGGTVSVPIHQDVTIARGDARPRRHPRSGRRPVRPGLGAPQRPRTSRRGATRRPSRRSGRRSRARAASGFSTSTPTPTTTARCSRWPASPGGWRAALLEGAREAVARIDLNRHAGIHPHVGAIDVVPLVHLDAETRGAGLRGGAGRRRPDRPRARTSRCCSTARSATAAPAPSCAAAARWASRPGSTAASCVPTSARSPHHPTAGATLLAARPPLVAFNLELAAPAGVETAKEIAGAIREGGPEGLPGAAGHRPLARARGRRAGLLQRRGSRRRRRSPRWSRPRAATRPSPEPSSSVSRRGPPSTASPRTCRSPASTRSATSSRTPSSN